MSVLDNAACVLRCLCCRTSYTFHIYCCLSQSTTLKFGTINYKLLRLYADKIYRPTIDTADDRVLSLVIHE